MKMKKVQKKDRYLIIVSIVLSLAGLIYFMRPVSMDQIKSNESLRILSREGSMLRQFRTRDEGSYSEWIKLSEYPSYLKNAILTAEDKYFYYHPGINPVSIMRSALINMRHGRIVAGGSTITQQVVRLVWRNDLPQNRYLRKITELFLSFRLELWQSKDSIYECYLNRIPLKYNQSGFPSASEKIFVRNIKYLSKEEIIALAVLVRQSEVNKTLFRKRFDNLWSRLEHDNLPDITAIEQKVFRTELENITSNNSSTRHFEEWVKNTYPYIHGDFKTEISGNLNEKISEIVNSELLFLERYDVENAAVVVLSLSENDCVPLVAMVGSRDFYGKETGQVNGALSIREAGSSLKPLLYALAMDKKGYLPNTIISDREMGFRNENDEIYMPRNYDLKFWGNLTVREALGASRNIPAVDTLRTVGISAFYNLLKNAGNDHMTNPPDYYGYGLALGTGGVTLATLTAMYSSIAKKGELNPILVGTDNDGNKIYIGNKTRMMSERSSYYITDILNDRDIRRRSNGTRNFLDFPFDIAVKTGTSKDYRDAWTVGFTNKYAVGVWTGNFSGTAMKRVSGTWGSGRIFQQVFRLLTGNDKPAFSYPEDYRKVELCRSSGKIASAQCPKYSELLYYLDIPKEQCSLKHDSSIVYDGESLPRILSPIDGEVFLIDPSRPNRDQPVPIQVMAGKNNLSSKNLFVRMDNKPKFQIHMEYNKGIIFSRGEHSIGIIYNDEEIETVNFEVQ
jgi:penicillin-binding protein 1C